MGRPFCFLHLLLPLFISTYNFLLDIIYLRCLSLYCKLFDKYYMVYCIVDMSTKSVPSDHAFLLAIFNMLCTVQELTAAWLPWSKKFIDIVF